VPATLETLRTSGDAPVGRALLAAVEAEFGPEYGPPAPGDPATVRPEELSPPGGTYVALVMDGEPVAGGGIRRLDASTGEVKRMYVVPGLRRRGLARRLLAEIEAAGRDMGLGRLRLDTIARLVPFYVSAGYAPIADYNGNRHAAFWGEKAL
jgi:GNAT superfamily N-acetyltransferase